VECDPKGKCPKCGYANAPGAQRCVRCRSILFVPAGCTGACSKCLLKIQPKEDNA
jgi:hypothetical protein